MPGAADADVAAADVASALAGAVGEPAGAVVGVGAVVAAAAAAAGSRRDFLNCPSVTMPRSSQLDLPLAACANLF